MNISDRHPVEKHTRQSPKCGINTNTRKWTPTCIWALSTLHWLKTSQMNIHNQLIIQDPRIPATRQSHTWWWFNNHKRLWLGCGGDRWRVGLASILIETIRIDRAQTPITATTDTTERIEMLTSNNNKRVDAMTSAYHKNKMFKNFEYFWKRIMMLQPVKWDQNRDALTSQVTSSTLTVML